MSGRGISKLGLPSDKYRVDRHFEDFEPQWRAECEDSERAELIRRTMAERPDCRLYDAYRDLPDLLKRAFMTGEAPQTLASATYMRKMRINICGAIWELIEKSGVENVSAFTIIPESWEYSDDLDVHSEDYYPEIRIRRLRTALYNLGAKDANGWVIAFYHGEYEPNSGVYRPHVHGFACGEMIEIVNRLRLLPNYETRQWLPDESPSPVYRRVVISRKLLTDLPRAVTYCLQSFWPSRPILLTEEGERIRARRKGRIPEPNHTNIMVQMHLWRIEDITLMMGLRVTKDGLKQTKPVS